MTGVGRRLALAVLATILIVSAGHGADIYGGKVHYDGAKNEETVIQVWGMGPATSTPAEKR